MLSMNFILSCNISSHKESVATLFNNFQAAVESKLKVIVLIKKWRYNFSVVKVIDVKIDTFSLWNIVSISFDGHFIYLDNHKFIDPFNTSIHSLVL